MELSAGSGTDLDMSFETRVDRALDHRPYPGSAAFTAAGATGAGGAVSIGSGIGLNVEVISPIPQTHSPLPGVGAGFFADSSLGTSSAAGIQG